MNQENMIEPIELHKDIDPTPQEMTQEEIDALARDAVEAVVKEDVRKPFFNAVRHSLFSGKLNQKQVDGMNAILDGTKDLPINQQAYILATVYHETGIVKRVNGVRVMFRDMQPVVEMDKGAGRKYGTWKVNSNGDKFCEYDSSRDARVYLYKEYPNLYYGRGLVQLTWLSNYIKMGQELFKRQLFSDVITDDLALARNPDLVLRPEISVQILLIGMLRGSFTGLSLGQFVDANKADFVGARRVINGRDKDNEIATIAQKFKTALKEMA